MKLKLNKGIVRLLCLYIGANVWDDDGVDEVDLPSSSRQVFGAATSGVVAKSDVEAGTSSEIMCPDTPLLTEESSSPS